MERLFSGRRLVRAVELKTDTDVVGYETRMRSKGTEEPIKVRVEVARLEPKVLWKLKTKSIASFRGDLFNEGRGRIAQIILGEDKHD